MSALGAQEYFRLFGRRGLDLRRRAGARVALDGVLERDDVVDPEGGDVENLAFADDGVDRARVGGPGPEVVGDGVGVRPVDVRVPERGVSPVRNQLERLARLRGPAQRDKVQMRKNDFQETQAPKGAREHVALGPLEHGDHVPPAVVVRLGDDLRRQSSISAGSF